MSVHTSLVEMCEVLHLLKNSHLRIYLLILQREEGREGERETCGCERGEKNINRLPPLHAQAGD